MSCCQKACVAACALMILACTTSSTETSGEEIEVVEVPLPEGVSIPSQQNSTGFTADGSRLFTNVVIEGVEGRHVATLARDGSSFQCLTCDDLASPTPHPRYRVTAKKEAPL